VSVRLLADDLTGALDAGAEFAGDGPVMAFWHGGLPETWPDHCAIDSGTRELGTAAARAAVSRLAPALATGEVAFKKIDSLMRGATVAEIAACFATGLWRAAVLAPAFPFHGRVTRQGRQWARAGAGWAPAGPDLVAALHAEGIAAQAGRLGGELADGISVFDAETDADLEQIARDVPRSVLWIGTGGLARAVAGSEAVASARLERPILGLFGSDQAATFAQLRACAPHWLHLDDDGAGVDTAWERGMALLSVAVPDGFGRAAAAAWIGAALHRQAARLHRPGSLIVAGGETLRGVCQAFGARSLALEGRIQPGLPRAVIQGGEWDGVTVVTKSGAFGAAGLLRDLLVGNGFVFDEVCP